MSAYLVRSSVETLRPTLAGAEDRLFINQRFDGETLHEGLYVRCTFANVSFLRSTLEDVRFSACVFEACYFRETTLKTCRFSGSRFINCDFVKPTIVGCDFAYARFNGCFPPAHEMEANLPIWHNLREAVASNLSSEAQKAGNGGQAREYLLQAIGAREQHLLAAARAQTQYYRGHFPSSLDRLMAFLRYLLSRLNGYLWGYGERGWPLLRSLIVVALVVWPLLFLLTRGSIESTGDGNVTYGDCLWLSVDSVLGRSGVTSLNTTGFARALVLSEGLIGLLLLGLFVTYVFRYVTRR